MAYLSVMPGKDDIEPPAAAQALKGLAARLADRVTACADTLTAEPIDRNAIDRTLRTLALIARAASAVHGLQAAEDRADARTTKARADRAAARVLALNPNPAVGDETDMNEQDPRLDDPKLMAEADKELERRLDALALEIKAQSLPRNPARPPAPCGARQLDDAKPPPSAPAH
jgi:hypothetical protein